MPPKSRSPYISRFSEILDDDTAKENISTIVQNTSAEPGPGTLLQNDPGKDNVSGGPQETGGDKPPFQPQSKGSNEDGGVALEPDSRVSESPSKIHLKNLEISADLEEMPQLGHTKQISDEQNDFPHEDIRIGKHVITCQTGGLKTGQNLSSLGRRYIGYVEPKDRFIKKARDSCTLEEISPKIFSKITTSSLYIIALPFASS